MWLSVDKDGTEYVSKDKPTRENNHWQCTVGFEVEKGTVERVLKYPLSWDNEAEEI